LVELNSSMHTKGRGGGCNRVCCARTDLIHYTCCCRTDSTSRSAREIRHVRRYRRVQQDKVCKRSANCQPQTVRNVLWIACLCLYLFPPPWRAVSHCQVMDTMTEGMVKGPGGEDRIYCFRCNSAIKSLKKGREFDFFFLHFALTGKGSHCSPRCLPTSHSERHLLPFQYLITLLLAPSCLCRCSEL
jgi:hypothetical protein